jgi:hypothetical protein
MTTIIHRILVVLLLPLHIPDLIKYGQGILAAMTNNIYFPNPNPVLVAFADTLTKLDAAETTSKTRAKGTIAARNAAKVVFIGAFHALKAQVQGVADADPEKAEAIITSTTMSVKKTAIRVKVPFAAKYGPISGTVRLVAKAAAARASYDWEWSGDGGKTWTSVPSTLQAKVTILALPVATNVLFRYRVVTKAGEGDWSQPISLLVK